ncbi:MAG: hypothetical protein IMZ52_01680 [Actinobacteria bacterium]|nr:hypothetical protein [Actinomycetota bacterium]MBE3114807.1 hypothetical protein [Actinomycetota bacterium]
MKKVKEKETSEFGKGLTYNLALFLAHQERFFEYRNKIKSGGSCFDYGLWFNGAGDHLYGLEIPKSFPKKLQKRLQDFQTKVLTFRNSLGLNEVTEKDIVWALRETKDLLMEIDGFLGIKSIKGEWE